MSNPVLRIVASRLTRGGFQISYGRKIIGTVPDVETIAVETGKLLHQIGILPDAKFQITIVASDSPPIMGRVVEPPPRPVPSASQGKPRPQVRGWRDDDLPDFCGTDEPEYKRHIRHEGRKLP